MRQLVTSESVTAGHPDKLADQISDSVVDQCMQIDPFSRVACEVLLTKGLVVVAGEISCSGDLNYDSIVRKLLISIGYDSPEKGIDGNSCAVLAAVGRQSPDINQGVDRKNGPQGADDQGLMYGFATWETESFMPTAIMAAHDITRKLHLKRETGDDFLLPDGKSQVSVSYESGSPVIESIVISTQHKPDADLLFLSSYIQDSIIKELSVEYDISPDCVYHINPTGRFVLGGPAADCGVTGRKIIVDTYGGVGRHGGGAFSGKDPSKVDRSGAYAARQLAKSLVYGKLCDEAEVQLAYAIGVAEPVSVFVKMKNPRGWSDAEIAESILQNVDLTPEGIIRRLRLIDFARKPGFVSTATYGHFTSNFFPWEETSGLDDILGSIL